MASSIFTEIEKYIREMIAKNDDSFNRDAILMQSKEWMEKYPVEFNSTLNMIEIEGGSGGCGSDFMDDSTPSFHHGSTIYTSDETPSVLHIQDDPMGSPNGSDEVDSSSNGNADDDEMESYIPLQRTMSSAPSAPSAPHRK